MGYSSPLTNIECWQYDTSNLIVSSDTETTTVGTTAVLAKEFTLQVPIYQYSDFYLTADIKSGTNSQEARAYLYINDVLVSYKDHDTTTYTTVNWTLKGYTWTRGVSTIKIRIRTQNPGYTAYIKNVRLYGVNTPFEVTQETV